MQQSIITCRDLVWQPKKTAFSLQAIDLDIYVGEFLTLLGPSGCGKTSLLRLLGGLIEPASGDLLLRGKRINGLDAAHRPINMVFQNYALFPFMSVADNVGFALRCQGIRGEAYHQRISEILEKVHLTGFEKRYPSELSGGQQQRVAIARALINKPSVLLLDEPMSALDKQIKRSLRRELKSLQKELGITFVMVTHDQEEALSMSDRIVLMREGRIVQIDTPRGMYESPKTLYAAQFIGEANIFRLPVKSVHDKSLIVTLCDRTFLIKKPLKHEEITTHVNLIIRPEDFQAWDSSEIESDKLYLPGRVESVIYKGSTVELQVILSDGTPVSVTEFFDETDETLDYRCGESVHLSWQAGWEVVLNDDS